MATLENLDSVVEAWVLFIIQQASFSMASIGIKAEHVGEQQYVLLGVSSSKLVSWKDFARSEARYMRTTPSGMAYGQHPVELEIHHTLSFKIYPEDSCNNVRDDTVIEQCQRTSLAFGKLRKVDQYIFHAPKRVP